LAAVSFGGKSYPSHLRPVDVHRLPGETREHLDLQMDGKPCQPDGQLTAWFGLIAFDAADLGRQIPVRHAGRSHDAEKGSAVHVRHGSKIPAVSYRAQRDFETH
jgi:hypothetical protein